MKKMAALAAFLLCALAGSGLHAGQREIVLKEYLHHNWRCELLNYTMNFKPGECKEPEFQLTEGEQVIPCQASHVYRHEDGSVRQARISLVADLLSRRVRRFTLRWGEDRTARKAPPTDLFMRRAADKLAAETSLVGVQVPAGRQRYDPPAAPEDVPAPLLAIKMNSGKWIGAGRLGGGQKITARTTTVVEEGPVTVLFEVTYDFEKGGHSVMGIRVTAGQNVVLISEEFDTDHSSTTDYRLSKRDNTWKLPHFAFDFGPGLNPQLVQTSGGRGPDPKWNRKAYSNRGSFEVGDNPSAPLAHLFPWRKWWPGLVSWMGLWPHEGASEDFVGLFACQAGTWMRPYENAPSLYTPAPNSAVLRAPLGWGRRKWGIVTGLKQEMIPQPSWPPTNSMAGPSPMVHVRNKYDLAPLDKVKDMVLEWNDEHPPEGALAKGPVAYPHLFFPPRKWPSVQKRFKRSPQLMQKTERYCDASVRFMATGESEAARQFIFGHLNDYHEWGLMRWVSERIEAFISGPGLIGSQQLDPTHVPAYLPFFYDLAMASDLLTPEQRQYLRAGMAFLAYMQADPSYWPPRQLGYAMGNPNFRNMQFVFVGLLGCALSAHPESKRWADWAAKELEQDILVNSAPGGAWIESDGYQLVSIQADVCLAIALRHAGYEKEFFRMPRLKETLYFLTQRITPKDPRFGRSELAPIGRTMKIEGMGLLAWAAYGYQGIDDEFSAHLMWAWKQCGEELGLRTFGMSENTYMALPCTDPGLPARPLPRKSAHYPGFGCILWNDSSSPDATYWVGPNGYFVPYDDPAMSFVLHAKGAPLCTDWGYTAYVPRGKVFPFMSWMHSKIGIDNTFTCGNISSAVRDYSFFEAADYYWGNHVIREVADWPWKPEDTVGWTVNEPKNRRTIKPVTIRRAVVFVKDADPLGPNYFLVRDEARGNQKMSWNLWSLSKEITKLKAHLWRATGQYGVDMDLFFIAPEDPDFARDQWTCSWAGYDDTQLCMRLRSKREFGVFWVLYPRRPEEPEATFSALPGGAGVKVELPDRTDYVFLSYEPTAFEGGGVVFNGKAGVAREWKDGRLDLTLSAAGRLAAGDLALEGTGAVSVRRAGNEIRGRMQKAGTETKITVAGANLADWTLKVDGEKAPVKLQEGAALITAPNDGAAFALSLPR